MTLVPWRRFASTLVESLSGGQVAALVDPSLVTDAPAAVRAVAAFVLVLLFSAGMLVRFRPFVDRSIDASMERPAVSLVYGLALHGLVLFATGYVLTQLVQVEVALSDVSAVGVVILALVWLLLAGLGFTVVGATLTEVTGRRQHWQGAVVGAALGAAAAFVEPLLLGTALWILVVSVGIGGPMKRWLHASQAAEAEVKPD